MTEVHAAVAGREGAGKASSAHQVRTRDAGALSPGATQTRLILEAIASGTWHLGRATSEFGGFGTRSLSLPGESDMDMSMNENRIEWHASRKDEQ